MAGELKATGTHTVADGLIASVVGVYAAARVRMSGAYRLRICQRIVPATAAWTACRDVRRLQRGREDAVCHHAKLGVRGAG